MLIYLIRLSFMDQRQERRLEGGCAVVVKVGSAMRFSLFLNSAKEL
jgi:hypothetical protein